MKHEFEGGMTIGTPDNPPEGYSYCANCGAEETDDNKDEECAPIEDEDVAAPGVGDVVLYALEGGQAAPAVVTRVHTDSLAVNLRVLLDVSAVDAGEVAEYWTREWLERTGYCPPEFAVQHDANGEGGTWRHVALPLK